MKYDKELNHGQYRAVMHNLGPALVISGAGTGKTRVITYRLSRLINEKQINPKEILLLTFTRKASEEMKLRASKITGENIDVSGQTFHSFAVSVLRKYANLLGYKNNFLIYDVEDCHDLIKLILNDYVDDSNLKDKNFPKTREIYTMISKIKNQRVSFSEVYFETEEYKSDVKNVIKTFEERKFENNVFDYDDLLLKLLTLLKEEKNVLKKIAQQYKYIMVDEYQDTNFAQNEILLQLFKENKNILVVGDDMQSIYSFRGAKVSNILNFCKNFKGAKIYKIELNYRSQENILNFVNFFSSKLENTFSKKLEGIKKTKNNEPIMLYQFERKEDEAIFIKEKILESKNDENLNYSSWAILTRNSNLANSVQIAFDIANIPYRVYGGIRFAQRKHVRDLLSYFRILQNLKDTVSLNRVLLLLPKIGNLTSKKIINFILENDININNLGDIKLSQKSSLLKSHLNFFSQTMQSSNVFLEKENKLHAFDSIKNYYIDLTKIDIDRKRDLEVLKDIFLSSNNLNEFLINFALDPPNMKKSSGEYNDFVTISTIHSVKGLEFDRVFLLGVTDQIMPSGKWKNKEDYEEEMRLFYVACTRAKEKLFLSTTMQDTYFYYSGKSPFIKNIPKELMSESILLKRSFYDDEISSFLD